MKHTLSLLALFALCLVAATQAAAQARLPAVSLCDLQTRVTQGERWNVQVAGVYLADSDARYLVAPVCSGLGTRVEFELKNHKRLSRLNRKSRNRQTLVVFDGEFYGAPATPDPKQPRLRPNDFGGQAEATRTKMVVHSILSVKALPKHNPCILWGGVEVTHPEYKRVIVDCPR